MDCRQRVWALESCYNFWYYGGEVCQFALDEEENWIFGHNVAKQRYLIGLQNQNFGDEAARKPEDTTQVQRRFITGTCIRMGQVVEL